MLVSIGIRCTPNEVFYSVSKLDQDETTIEIIDKLVVPVALDVPEKLKFIRHTFLDIIAENQISRACLRITETIARPNRDRVMIEAVMQELIASSSIEKYIVGVISNMFTRLDIPKTDFKLLVSGAKTFRELGIWNQLDSNEREAVLAAFTALNI